jgi:hypothetical protein
LWRSLPGPMLQRVMVSNLEFREGGGKDGDDDGDDEC